MCRHWDSAIDGPRVCVGHSLRSGLVELHLEVFGEAETGQVRDPYGSCDALAKRKALANRPGANGASLS